MQNLAVGTLVVIYHKTYPGNVIFLDDTNSRSGYLCKRIILVSFPQMTHHLLYLPSYIVAGVLLFEVIDYEMQCIRQHIASVGQTIHKYSSKAVLHESILKLKRLPKSMFSFKQWLSNPMCVTASVREHKHIHTLQVLASIILIFLVGCHAKCVASACHPQLGDLHTRVLACSGLPNNFWLLNANEDV